MSALDSIKKQLKQESSISPASGLVACAFYSRTIAHELHLKTNSFAQHKALNDYYDEVVDIVDRFAESYQGKYGVIARYKNESEECTCTPLEYFTEFSKEIEGYRSKFTDGYLQQIIDELLELIYSTIYKLKFLN